MNNHWDARFSGENFYYGEVPNSFFADFLSSVKFKGKILLPGEGEGRNAVYAAGLGWDVTAFDSSEVARAKALKYARQKSLKITYQLIDIVDYQSVPDFYDVVALVFVHQPAEIRKTFHAELIKALKPGGLFFMAAFAKEQINHHSGGPSDPDLLYSFDVVKNDFLELKQTKLCQEKTHIKEGRHQGLAEVLIYTGQKMD